MNKLTQSWRTPQGWGSAILLGLLVWLCYHFALQLPFFHDDLPIISWLQQYSWRDIWLGHENNYYRPLAFSVYKLGLLLPLGGRQVVLHAVNLVMLWLGAVLVRQIALHCEHHAGRALLAGALFVIFPFFTESVPWITALSHPLVVTLTLLSAYAALKATATGRSGYWGVSLLATALAPLAHESGAVCGVIVGGLVIIQSGVSAGWPRRTIFIVFGGLLNVVAVVARQSILGSQAQLTWQGLPDLPQNSMFFLQGLLYPLGPIFDWLIQQWGWHDFTLIGLTGLGCGLGLLWLARQSQSWRWLARALWWWFWSALPAALSLPYGAFFVGPRLYTLAAAGTVMLWAGIIILIEQQIHQQWWRRVVWLTLAGTLICQNFIYLRHEQRLYTLLDDIYAEVLSAAADKTNSPLGLVNVPSSLTWEDRTYPLVTDGIVFVPGAYSNIAEFIEVNLGWREAEALSVRALYQETDPFWLTLGPWMEGASLRQFLGAHRTIWLGRHAEGGGRFWLDYVGQLTPGSEVSADPLVRFENGPALLSAQVEREAGPRWRIDLEWLAAGPVEATVFLHIRDGEHNFVTQADGAALGGILPLSLWQAGDLIHDIRYVLLPPETVGSCTVQVGLYHGEQRFPAFQGEERCPDDAATVVEFTEPGE
ncbi:MAG TPA: hypothetical protein G4N98_02430 [Thermoflexia bacterium]|nr:hypothetical protein [Thermoflexia bacterium]